MKNIIIPAYNNTEFIEDCLNSCFQTPDTIVWLGIDGCPETLEKVLRIRKRMHRLKLFYFAENRGTYVTLNTLIDKIPQDEAFLIFGSDDTMNDGMVRKMFNSVRLNQPVYSRYTGIVCMYKSDYDHLGSFRAWPISADTEFSTRAKRIMEYKNVGMLFYCRKHEGQITKSKELGFGSPARKMYGEFILNDTPHLPVYVAPVLHNKQLEIGKITANMATFPPREKVLQRSLKSLLDNQFVDKIRLYMNEYDKKPNFIPAKVEVLRGDNIKDSGKLWWATEQKKEIYFTMDDDLYYSERYIFRHIMKLAEHPDSVVTIHGRRLRAKPEKFTDAEIMEHWKNANDKDTVIHLPGTGVSCFSLNNIQFSLPKYHGMTDVHVGVECRKKAIQVICRARDHDELRYLLPLDEENTLWHERKSMEKECKELLRSVDWS